jgi:dTDP-4-dehydrorhamnose 3,5-epimerase-like enzyme
MGSTGQSFPSNGAIGTINGIRRSIDVTDLLTIQEVRYDLLVDDPTIPGCELVHFQSFHDERGELIPILSEVKPNVQYAYWSRTKEGYARDIDRWHIHTYHSDRFIVVGTSCYFALSDGSRTELVLIEGDVPHCMLIVPPGVYHSLCAPCGHIGGTTIMSFPTEIYDPADEGRVPFGDLKAPWPWRLRQGYCNRGKKSGGVVECPVEA